MVLLQMTAKKSVIFFVR